MNHSDAATRLVEVAIEMLHEDPGLLLVSGIRGEDVCKRAAISQTTFYRHFNKQSFIDAVAAQLVPDVSDVDDEFVLHAIAALTKGSRDPRVEVRALAHAQFQSLRTHGTVTRRLLANALGTSRPETLDDLRRVYRTNEAKRSDLIRAIFEAWGASPRAPFTINHFAVTLNAIAEGLTMRRRADPDAVPDWLYGEIVLALSASVVDTRQRDEHIDDVAAALATDIMDSRQGLRSQSLPPDPRSAVVKAARKEFEQRGYSYASLDNIATTSGVPIELIKRLFPAKQLIVVHALTRPIDILAESVGDDRAIGHSDIHILNRHLHRLAKLIIDERVFMDCLMGIVFEEARTPTDGVVDIKRQLDLISPIVPVLERAQAAGTVNAQHPVHELATALTQALMMRCFANRTAPPEANAQFVSDVTLAGMLA